MNQGIGEHSSGLSRHEIPALVEFTCSGETKDKQELYELW